MKRTTAKERAAQRGPSSRSQRSGPERGGPRRKRRRRTFKFGQLPRGLLAALLASAVGFAVALSGLFLWANSERAAWNDAAVPYIALELPAESTSWEAAQQLARGGWLSNATLGWLAQKWLAPFSKPSAGRHWLPRVVSARRVLQLVTRSSYLAPIKVTLPEGWDSFQMAERFAELGVCEAKAFTASALDPNAAQLLLGHASLEGYLYPATYELRPNSAPEAVAARLAREGVKRFDAAFEGREAQLQRVNLTEYQVVSLASVVQKEAADAEEFPLVASVFLNRLRSAEFRPAQHLQSDPTALYGCKRLPELSACQRAGGRLVRELLRDPENPYNTYRNPGIPPGPIGNPSTGAVKAVLEAPATDYLFFFAPRGGRHQFSRSFGEHSGAIERSNLRPENGRPGP